MTRAEQALASGYAALQSVSGRTCIFRSSEIVFLVDETGGGESIHGRPDLSPRLGTIFECGTEEITGGAPRAGEVITDDTERNHRIALVERRGNWWRITCQPSTTGAP